MADWTNIANTALQPGAPVRSIDGVALRDNPIAIAEGAAGAPRIAGQTGPAVQTNGIFDGAVTNAKIANRTIRGIKLMRIQEAPVVSVNAGNNSAVLGITQVSGTTSTVSTSFVTARTITIDRYTGSLRFGFRHCGGNAFDGQSTLTSSSEARILKNGSVLATWSTGFGSCSDRSIDVSITTGDVITIQHRRRVGDLVSVTIGSFFTRADNPYEEVTAVELRGNL